MPVIGDFAAWSRERESGGETDVEAVVEGKVGSSANPKVRGEPWSEVSFLFPLLPERTS